MTTAKTKLITPLAILSYPHLAAPQPAKEGQVPKYSAALIITPEVLADPKEKALFDAIQEAMLAAGVAKWADKFQLLIKGDGFKKGLRRDAEAKSYPAGSIYFNARSGNQPGLVYPWAAPGETKPARVPQEKIKEVFYPGAIVRASVSAFAFDNSGGKGLSLGLNNMQFIRDGIRLDSRTAAEDEFAADLSQAPASMDDLI